VVGCRDKHYSGMIENGVGTSRWNKRRMVGWRWSIAVVLGEVAGGWHVLLEFSEPAFSSCMSRGLGISRT
jgi:hypothetical protein